MSATLSDAFYVMQINNTPYVTDTGYDFGSDHAWSSNFTFNALPGGISYAMYDDTVGTSGANTDL